MTAPNDAAASKARLRSEMRSLRRSLPDVERRSEAICRHLSELDELAGPVAVMVFTPLRGEPDLAALVERCRAAGGNVYVPEDEPDPRLVDVIVVPALAYTATGDRLGQGGGWYDRFLPQRRPDAVAIGVAFVEQLVAVLPVEDHDARVDVVVTDAGFVTSSSPMSSPSPD